MNRVIRSNTRQVGVMPSVAAAVALALSYHASLAAENPPTNLPEQGRTGTLSLDIAAQPINEALNEFARQSGLQVFFLASEDSKQVISNPIAGSFEPGAALDRLLANTGLSYEYIDARSVAIVDPTSRTVGRPKQTSGARASGNGSERLAIAQTPQAATSTHSIPGSGLSGAAEQGAQGSGIEEVIVTAQKREERLIDTPQSVSVLSAESLAKMGATQFRDFADSVAGLSFQTTGAGSTQITLRGVTAGFDVGPAVGVYVDEVPYGSSSAFALGAQQALDVGLFDIERIEVLRGPQGTLYGASTMGGLIKYVSKRPDASRFAVDARVGLSSTENGGVSHNAAAVINAPLASEKVALRASGFYSRDGGYVDNLARGAEDVDTADIQGGRLDLLVTPTDSLDIRIVGFAQNVTRDGQSTIEFTPTGQPQYGELRQARLFPEPSEQRFRLLSATIGYEFDSAQLTSISSYQTAESEGSWDISAVYVPLLESVGRSYSAVRYPQSTHTDKFTQELRLSSKPGATLEWVVGGFYTKETSRWDEEFVLFDLNGAVAPNDLYTFGAPSRYEEYAAFGDLTFRITDRFDVTGGIRYANNRQVFTQFGSGLFIGSRPTGRSDEDVATYLANARYRFNDRSMAYFRFATGYRPGGPNAAANNAAGQPLGLPTFDADRLESYEIGYKAETDSRRFGIDLAAYHIDWSDMQLLTLIDGFAFRVNGTGGARIHGAELAITARPVSAFRMTGAFAWQDASLAAAEPRLGPPTIGALKGERLPNVPRFSGTLSADYDLPGKWQPSIGGTLRRVGERKTDFGPSAHRLPDYTTVDLRAGVQFGSVNTQFYIRNLLDEHGQLSVMFPQFGTRVAILQPRTFGVSLTTRF